MEKDKIFLNLKNEKLGEGDSYFLFNLAICKLKFDENINTAIKDAIVYIEKASERSNYYLDEANFSFDLAILYLIDGNIELAIEKLKYAENIDPDNFKIEDLLEYKNSWFYSTNFSMYRNLLYRLRHNEKYQNNIDTDEEFEDMYVKLLERAKQ